MISMSHGRTSAGSCLVAVALLLADAGFTRADQFDPTKPSLQITERLATDKDDVGRQPERADESRTLLPGQLRLKAIVLRDSDNGTALVSEGDSVVHVIALRRETLPSTSARLSIGRMHLVLTDFSDLFIVMEAVDTHHKYIID